jgi:hypothetical protein
MISRSAVPRSHGRGQGGVSGMPDAGVKEKGRRKAGWRWGSADRARGFPEADSPPRRRGRRVSGGRQPKGSDGGGLVSCGLLCRPPPSNGWGAGKGRPRSRQGDCAAAGELEVGGRPGARAGPCGGPWPRRSRGSASPGARRRVWAAPRLRRVEATYYVSTRQGTRWIGLPRGTRNAGCLPRVTRARCPLPGPDFHRRVREYPRHATRYRAFRWFPRIETAHPRFQALRSQKVSGTYSFDTVLPSIAVARTL